jgi:glucose/arabinose dehydrogenase
MRNLRLRPLVAAALCVVGLSWSIQQSASPQDKTGTDSPKIPAPDPRAAFVPDGYRVEVALDGLMYPSSIEFDDAGNIYIAECGHMPGDDKKPPRILKYSKGNLKDAKPETLSDGLSAPITDLFWHKGKLYIAHKGKISLLENGKVRDIVTGLASLGDHSNNQLCAGLDGLIYFGQGSATNSGVVGEDNFAFGWPKKHPEVCEIPGRDIVLRGQEFESGDPRNKEKQAKVKTSAFQPFGKTVPDGAVVKGQTKANSVILCMKPDGSDLDVFAWGFRNPYGIAFGPDKKLYVADAGTDARGSRPIANSLEMLWIVKKDAFYGWPDYYGGVPVTDPRFKPKKGPQPQFVMKDHPPVEKPFMSFELHASVTQIDVSRNAKFGFEGQLFMGSSGDQSAVTGEEEARAGYWVKRIDVSAGKAELFFQTRPEALGPKGKEYVMTAGPKRLVDVRFAPQGDALYVVDIGPIDYVSGPDGPMPKAFPNTGVIWRITRNQ